MTPATFGFPRLRSMTPVQLGSHSDEPPLTRAGPLFPGRNVPSSTGSVGGESFVFCLFELTLTVLSGARSVSGPQNGSGYMPEGSRFISSYSMSYLHFFVCVPGEGRRSVSEGFASRNAKDMDGGSPEGRADNEASQHWSPGDSDSSFNDAPIY
ncbi:hypothetical protein BDP27DRAFT_300205 [Rhodocollybia butyracea]|uniref:Uncharacterized protein n=1 Tax=Rhodocollybia butyracea TaxID=206335 RepID=A0A9P5UAT6_9AGAR|nr:hypothetical protein BDP27DRAFT_300205 [Rhodocollybia butyracea]